MAFPADVNALGSVSGSQTLAAAGHATRHNEVKTALEGIRDALGGTAVPSGTVQPILAAGSASAPSLSFTGDSNTGLWSPAADTVAASTGGTERMRIDSSGAVGIGMAPVTSGAGSVPSLSITTAANDGFAAFRGGADVNGQQILFHKTRNATPTSHTAVQADDQMGMLNFYGSDGSGWVRSAVIRGVVDGTVSSGDVPGRVVIFTKPVGGSITERMRIDNAGLITGTGTSLGAWTAYTPTLGGTGWAIGNGTTVARYCQIGKIVHFRGSFTFGSTSTFGASALATMTYPVTAATLAGGSYGSVGMAFDSSAGARYSLWFTQSSSTVVNIRYANGAVSDTSSTVPFTWATSDTLTWAFSYEAA